MTNNSLYNADGSWNFQDKRYEKALVVVKYAIKLVDTLFLASLALGTGWLLGKATLAVIALL